MPIQKHKLETTKQSNGSTHNVLRMYDQDGIGYMVSFFAPADADLVLLTDTKVSAMDVQLAESEFTQIVEAI